ncbi:hypothetical protein LCGC14_0676730 [marine sediment metagenome]|uniref:Uncharacterized protein n=1 Tax=marine sediment metagenome TaxID=412755 RepID=A0A0F9QUD3_9ZZZZ
MNLRDFRQMWEKDGLHFVEIERRKQGGATWILYNVTEPMSTSEYGRHYGLIVVEKQRKVVAHNFKNTQGGNWTRELTAWWEEHYAEGLVDGGGHQICA